MTSGDRIGWAALAACLGLSSRALAGPTPEDTPAAQGLREEGQRLLGEGRTAEACAKLEASNRLAPAVETLLQLGDCLERAGRTANAWSTFGEARSLAERLVDPRAAEAAAREKALSARLARVLLQPAEAPEGLEIYFDRRSLGASPPAGGIPVDAGRHTIDARAPGREPWSTVVEVADRPGTVTVTIPALTVRPPSGLSAQKTAGIAVGAVGIAGLLAGAVLGGLAAKRTGDSSPHCVEGTPDRCDPIGLEIRSEATTFANVSNVTFATGGVLTATGALLFFLAPSAVPGAGSAVRLRVAPAFGALSGVVVTGSY